MKLTKLNKKILRKMGLEPVKKVYNNLTEEEVYLYNTHRQKIKGKKKYDYMEITEPGAFKRSIFKYKNLKEWDERNFKYQEKWRHKHSIERREWDVKNKKKLSPIYEKKEYVSLYMNGDWFRFLEKRSYQKRRLVYGMIESSSSYILGVLESKLRDDIHTLYPSILIDKNHEKDEKTGLTKVEFEIRAAGKEKELEIKEKELIELYKVMEIDVLDMIEPYAMYTFRKEDSDKVDGLDMYIIGGIEAAENVSFKTFFKDFETWEQPIGVLDTIVNKLYKKYKKILLNKF